MSYQKTKLEIYRQLGGINTKVSPYENGPLEFLQLVNMDFQKPAALTQRWGTTQYIGQTLPGQVQGLFEFIQTSGFSQMVFSHSGGIWAGASTGLQNGLSLTNMGATFYYNVFLTDITYAAVQGFRFNGSLFQTPNFIFRNGATYIIDPIAMDQNRFDAANFVNNMFYTDGSKLLKYEGTTLSYFGLPLATSNGCTANTAGAIGSSLFLAVGSKYYCYISYVNNRGFQSQIFPALSIDLTDANVGITLNGNLGSSFIAPTAIANTPLEYGISSINLWCFAGGASSENFRSSTLPFSYDYRLLGNVAASGSTITNIVFGTSNGGQAFINANPIPPTNNYLSWGFSFSPISSVIGGTNGTFSQSPLASQYLEIYSNRLFIGGFSSAPSTVWFSDTGEPEGIDADWNFEVRTNDGDYITGMKSYNSKLYIFKNESLHELSGDSPDNFYVREVSDEYGLISNRAAVAYKDMMIFLSPQKKVIRFNGSNIEPLSDKIQPILDTMNINAARGTATAVHDQIRNSILIGLPVNGATTNNLTIVYDYLTQAWSTYAGYNPAVYASIRGRLDFQYPFFGDYLGRINNPGATYLSDNGVGISTVIQAPYFHDRNSVTRQYRRLFLDTTPSGITVPININFRQDYGTSIVLNRTMYANMFQNRIDYGIPAKSMSVEFGTFGSSFAFQLNGYTIEHRLQRLV